MKINQCFFLIPIGLCAVFFDLRKGKIPNELIVIGLILGCCFQIRQAKAVGLLLFLGGACIPGAWCRDLLFSHDGCGRYETLGGCRRISGTAEGGILYDCFVICRGGVVDFCIAQKKKSKDKAVVLLFLYSKAAEWCLGAISE